MDGNGGKTNGENNSAKVILWVGAATGPAPSFPDSTATATNKLVPEASPWRASDCLSLGYVSKLWVAMSYEREPVPL